MGERDASDELHDYARRGEEPVGDDDVTGGKVNARDVLPPVCHKHVKGAANASPE